MQSESTRPVARGPRALVWVVVALALLGLWLVLRSTGSTSPNDSEPPAGKPPDATSFEWPVPAGWKHETIPFPLDFAPELSYHGIEELRFMPGFFTPSAPDFWTYEFVWWLADPPALDVPTLSSALRLYFRGLAQAVGQGKYTFDPQRFRAELSSQGSGSEPILAGEVWSYDPFATGQELVLHVEVSLKRCPLAGRSALFFLVSPKPSSDPVWAALRDCAANWRCPH